MQVLLRELGKVPIFQTLTKPQQDAIAKIAIPLSARRGEMIARQGEPSQGFFIILSGSVNVHRVDKDGNERLIHTFQTGDSYAEASLLPAGNYPASSRAEVDCKLLLVPRVKLIELLRHDPNLALGMIASLSIRLHSVVASLEKLRGHNIRDRLVNWIISNKPRAGNPTAYTVRIPNTKADLAALLGMRPETLSRHFASLRKEGYIKIRSREITVLDTRAFSELAGADTKDN